MFRPTATLLVAALTAIRVVSAQTDASVGLGLGTVRYPGGTGLGIASLGPTLERSTAGQFLTLGAVVSALPHGDWYAQARGTYWIATPPMAGRWRLAADVALGATTSGAGTGASGTGQLIGEVLRIAPRWGVAFGGGPTSGWITEAPPVTAAHLRLRGWWQDRPGRLFLSSSIEPTRLLGAWFTDAGGGAQAHLGRIDARLWVSGRVSAVYGSKGAALGSADLRLSSTVTLEASGGNVLPDPYQGFPRAAFVTAGVRLHLGKARPWIGSVPGPVTLVRSPTGLLLRLRQRANTVAIAGDWNGWTLTPLDRTGPDQWEIVLPLSAGTYHYTLFFEGSAWTIPANVPSVPDGFGGRVAVLTVF